MACMCAETFAAECGCGSKAAEDAPIPSDPRVSPMNDGLHIPADSPALDLPRENAEIGGVDFKADSNPLPPDPRVSPLNKGLHSPSDTPTMAAEIGEIDDEKCDCGGDLVYQSGYSCMECGEYYSDNHAESFAVENADEVLEDLEDFIGAIAHPENLDDEDRLHNIVKFVWYVYGQEPLNGDDIDDITQALKEWNGEDDESFGAESKFDKLAKEIAEEYEEKGKSPKEAMEIGEATAAKIGRAKFGKRKFAKMGKKAESFGADEELEYPCDVCGKPSDYNFQDGTIRWEIKDDEFVGGKPKISEYAGDTQNDFYCKKHADLYESGSFYAESAFDRLEDEVADEYEEKGMSDKEAKRIGAAVAYDQGVKKYGKKIMTEAARRGVSARSLERRAEVGAHVPTRIAATTTQRGVVKTYDSIPAGDGHVVGQFTPNMDYAPSGMYGAESITDSISKGFGSVLGIMSGLIIGGFAMNAVALLKSDDEN